MNTYKYYLPISSDVWNLNQKLGMHAEWFPDKNLIKTRFEILADSEFKLGIVKPELTFTDIELGEVIDRVERGLFRQSHFLELLGHSIFSEIYNKTFYNIGRDVVFTSDAGTVALQAENDAGKYKIRVETAFHGVTRVKCFDWSKDTLTRLSAPEILSKLYESLVRNSDVFPVFDIYPKTKTCEEMRIDHKKFYKPK